ncbi:MAG: hypothetical protein Q8873_09055, partial [Bacillota bacterium]|nr:hypothetical protein [Bacillota bacterium]
MDNGKDKQEEYRCFIATEEFKEVKNDKETETVTYENPRRPIKNKRKKAIYHIDELKNIGLHRKIEEYARDLTRRLAVYAFAVITLVAFTFMLMTMCSVGYEGFINGKSVGVADSKEFLQGIREDVNKEIATLTGGDKTGQIKPLKFRFKIVSENNYTPKEKIRENMATFSSALMKGCSIYVDGKKVVVLKSPREAQEVLMAIKEQYYLKGMECTSEIMNKVELVNEQATYASSSTIEQAVRALNDVKDSSRDYMV